MHAFLIAAIEFDGRSHGPGVVECTEAEFHALGLRGAVRPATADECELHVRAIETAATAPAVETAALTAPRRRRVVV